jgi:hypothetical protein
MDNFWGTTLVSMPRWWHECGRDAQRRGRNQPKPRPKPDPVRAATARRMARLRARGGRGPL